MMSPGRHLHSLLVLAVLLCTPSRGAPASPATADVARAQPRVVGYYFAPTARTGFPVSSVRGELLTHVIYAFAAIGPDGSAQFGNRCLDLGDCAGQTAGPPGGNFAELRRLKQRYPHLKVLISFGGWGGSKHFSDAAATPQSRARFVHSALQLFIHSRPGVFDGIDLDWEYPVRGGLPDNSYRPDDRKNMTVLARELRDALYQQGRRDFRRYELAISIPAGPRVLESFELPALAKILDFIAVMTYDYHTAGKTAHFNAPLGAAKSDPAPMLNIEATVDRILQAGVPADRLLLGVPFYGYGYTGVPATNDGLFQNAERNGMEDPEAGPKPRWAGSIRFYDIANAMKQGFARHWEPGAKVPWLYNPTERAWITYDDAESIALKAEFARTRGLGGIMIWELSGDDGTLLPLIAQRLGARRS